MSELIQQQCQACQQGAPQVTDQELADMHIQIPAWTIEVRNGIAQLERVYTFSSYTESMAFTQKVGQLAESEDHHPALLTEWGRVKVTWWTHAISGLHLNDFICAAKTDQLH